MLLLRYTKSVCRSRADRVALKKNREKPRDQPNVSRSYPADNHRSEASKEKRAIDHDLISGFKFASRNPEDIKTFKSQFITDGNDDPKSSYIGNNKPKRPDDEYNNHKQFINGADNHRLSAEFSETRAVAES